MTRVSSLFLVLCLVSLSVCRHLDNVLSDARTIRTQVTPDTQSAGGNSGSDGDSNTAGAAQRLTGSPKNINADVQNPTGNIIKPQWNFPQVLTTMRTKSNTHSEDVLTPAVILTDEPHTAPETTSGLHDSHLDSTPVQDSKDTHSQLENNGNLPPSQLQDANTDTAAAANTDPLAINDNRPLIDANGEKKDYEKNHAQLETAPNSVRTEDGAMGSEMKEKSNADTDLPYVKLDNVNDAHVDNTPIIRPEMNHIDNSIDEVEKIVDMQPTIHPTMPINPSKDVTIANEPSDAAAVASADHANSDVLNDNTVTTSSPDTVDQDMKTRNSVPSPDNIIQSEGPLKPQSDRGVIRPTINTNVGQITPNRIQQKPVVTPNVTPDITDTVNNPPPGTDSMVKKSDNNPTPVTAVEDPIAVNGVNEGTTSLPVDSGAESGAGTILVNTGVNEAMPIDTVAETDKPVVSIDNGIVTTTPAVPVDTVADNGKPAIPADVIESANVNRDPEDVAPLDIFVDDITYQRFPNAMPLAVFKEKIVGQTFKKLYILESSEKKLFQNVRQLEVTYQLEDEELYAEFLFRFIYSRQCTRIEKFKLGKLVQNSDTASFEKGVEDAKTERLVFFSQRPDDYMFLMSCTDEKNSPYACRETYYVTLGSKRDPPNQFPWLDAARELQTEMNLSFEDPRFIFNFVMMPCARALNG